VGLAPVVFQENMAKRLEMRVTVVGEQVFAAEIRSPEHFRTGTDWRHYQEFGCEGFYAVHSLPADVSQRCVRLCQELGLCYGAIDLILTPTGEYVFLEVNPGGQWGWIEEFTGLPISEAVARLLMDAAATRNGR
jgi:glutathione synthase/RimK-type ligase-like ATP-grasp enzyme